ncbi:MAG: sulfotransferase [Micromonosporaceae bacterium]|nr:sulfotransferase [Micromonosporaceae bacterium]
MFRSDPSPRLVPSPGFLLSAPRSGSTLLRNILNTHSRIHVTPELNLTEVGVQFLRFPAEYGMHTIYTELAFGESGLTDRELEHLLWDRVLHRALVRSGKEVLVHKAPRVLLRWRRIAECWPEARYLFLLRHPMNVVAPARLMAAPGTDAAAVWSARTDFYLRFLYLLREARNELPGLTVRYEDLTSELEKVCRQICDFLRVGWESAMLDYGIADHGRLAPGSGNMGAKLRSGRLQPGRPLPSGKEVPQTFRPICADLGYAAQPTGAEPA